MDKEQAFVRFYQVFDYLRSKGQIHSWVDFAKSLGVSKSYISDVKADRGGKFSVDFLKRIAATYSELINEDWLLTGTGKMEKPSKDMRPHYPATAEAGWLGGETTVVMDYEVEMEPAIKRFPDYDYMIDVSGPSMEPTYFDGDSVACRRIYNKKELKPGKSYVFVTRDGIVIKRLVSSTLSSLRVASDNPEYKPYSIDYDSLISIAEVVGAIHTTGKYDEYMSNTILRYAQSVIASNIEAAAISDAERQKILNLILNNKD